MKRRGNGGRGCMRNSEDKNNENQSKKSNNKKNKEGMGPIANAPQTPRAVMDSNRSINNDDDCDCEMFNSLLHNVECTIDEVESEMIRRKSRYDSRRTIQQMFNNNDISSNGYVTLSRLVKEEVSLKHLCEIELRLVEEMFYDHVGNRSTTEGTNDLSSFHSREDLICRLNDVRHLWQLPLIRKGEPINSSGYNIGSDYDANIQVLVNHSDHNEYCDADQGDKNRRLQDSICKTDTNINHNQKNIEESNNIRGNSNEPKEDMIDGNTECHKNCIDGDASLISPINIVKEGHQLQLDSHIQSTTIPKVKLMDNFLVPLQNECMKECTHTENNSSDDHDIKSNGMAFLDSNCTIDEIGKSEIVSDEKNDNKENNEIQKSTETSNANNIENDDQHGHDDENVIERNNVDESATKNIDDHDNGGYPESVSADSHKIVLDPTPSPVGNDTNMNNNNEGASNDTSLNSPVSPMSMKQALNIISDTILATPTSTPIDNELPQNNSTFQLTRTKQIASRMLFADSFHRKSIDSTKDDDGNRSNNNNDCNNEQNGENGNPLPDWLINHEPNSASIKNLNDDNINKDCREDIFVKNVNDEGTVDDHMNAQAVDTFADKENNKNFKMNIEIVNRSDSNVEDKSKATERNDKNIVMTPTPIPIYDNDNNNNNNNNNNRNSNNILSHSSKSTRGQKMIALLANNDSNSNFSCTVRQKIFNHSDSDNTQIRTSPLLTENLDRRTHDESNSNNDNNDGPAKEIDNNNDIADVELSTPPPKLILETQLPSPFSLFNNNEKIGRNENAGTSHNNNADNSHGDYSSPSLLVGEINSNSNDENCDLNHISSNSFQSNVLRKRSLPLVSFTKTQSINSEDNDDNDIDEIETIRRTANVETINSINDNNGNKDNEIEKAMKYKSILKNSNTVSTCHSTSSRRRKLLISKIDNNDCHMNVDNEQGDHYNDAITDNTNLRSVISKSRGLLMRLMEHMDTVISCINLAEDKTRKNSKIENNGIFTSGTSGNNTNYSSGMNTTNNNNNSNNGSQFLHRSLLRSMTTTSPRLYRSRTQAAIAAKNINNYDKSYHEFYIDNDTKASSTFPSPPPPINAQSTSPPSRSSLNHKNMTNTTSASHSNNNSIVVGLQSLPKVWLEGAVSLIDEGHSMLHLMNLREKEYVEVASIEKEKENSGDNDYRGSAGTTHTFCENQESSLELSNMNDDNESHWRKQNINNSSNTMNVGDRVISHKRPKRSNHIAKRTDDCDKPEASIGNDDNAHIYSNKKRRRKSVSFAPDTSLCQVQLYYQVT